MTNSRSFRRSIPRWAALLAALAVPLMARARQPVLPGSHVVLAWNDLGMHCMNADYSEIMVLPPFNTLHAQVIVRGTSPDIATSTGDYTVRYWLPSNTHAADKTNFWKYPQALLGNPTTPDVGVFGATMNGTMAPVAPAPGVMGRDWQIVGVPLIPTDDDGRENAYPLAEVRVVMNGTTVAQTRAVMPVSTEMSCNLCHTGSDPTISVAGNILKSHDRLHATTLYDQRPVACANCHSDNALGAPGQAGVSSLSAAMHGAHASRVGTLNLANACYACHPGIRTNCQRDVHAANGVTCTSCHGDMAAVGAPTRNPWVDEPRCASCHTKPGFAFEQAGTLYRNATGHGGVHCAACHGSPHSIGAATTAIDNVQATLQQGHAGKINTCTVCHTQPPGSFFHSVGD